MNALDAGLTAMGLLLKATFLIGAGLLAGRLMRRSGADARHLLWTATLFGLLVLPPLGALLPEWRAPLPAALSRFKLPGGASGSSSSPVLALNPGPGRDAAAETAAHPVEQPTVPAQGSSPLEILSVAFLVVWAGGVLVVLGLMWRGHLEMRHAVRNARELRKGHWADESVRAATAIGLRRPVRLLETSATFVPVTWGVSRPVVLLPGGSSSWSAERRRAVLLHEFAHIARLDCAVEHLTWLVCAVYWFHPGVWYAARRIRAERERACDDRVVAAGTPAVEYATHLVDVASGIPTARGHALAALAMTTRGPLESRLVDLLDPTRSRARLGGGMRLAVGAATLAGVAGTAMLHPAPATASHASNPALIGPAEPGSSDSTQFPIAPNGTVSFSGRVAPGDTVSVRASMGSIVVDTASGSQVRVTATRRTGPRGMTAPTRVAIMGVPGGVAICSLHLDRGHPMAPCEVNGDWGRGSVDDNAVDFQVLVPPGVHLKLLTGLGDLRALALGGTISALTGNGWAEISGDGGATVDAYSGRIGYTMLAGGSTAPVLLRVKHGGIDIQFDRDASAAFEVSPGRGTVRSTLPGTVPISLDRSLSGRLGGGRRSLVASLEKGDISLRLTSP